MHTPHVTPWAESSPPTESTLRRLCEEQNLNPYQWSNGPHDTYGAHSHTYDKVIYVVRGSITFGLPELGRKLDMKEGDRLDLPAGTVHDALVGAHGVVCLEAHK
jgi:quercetin dioxygenase-like cupin family protein